MCSWGQFVGANSIRPFYICLYSIPNFRVFSPFRVVFAIKLFSWFVVCGLFAAAAQAVRPCILSAVVFVGGRLLSHNLTFYTFSTHEAKSLPFAFSLGEAKPTGCRPDCCL
jgi:hypothetical protein